MRKALTCLAALILCLCTVMGAAAEASLVPQLDEWDASAPAEIKLSANVAVHMPFDEDRCAQLNALLKHISLRLTTHQADGAQLSRAAVQVDGKDAMHLTRQERDGEVRTQYSFQPDVTYVGGEESMALYGLDGSEIKWLDDAHTLVTTMGAALEDYAKRTNISTAIQGMGTAKKKIFYTVPKADVEVFVQAVRDYCPEGELRDLLLSCTFTGTQKLILWLNKDGDPIRAEYAGTLGQEGQPARTVSLKWRMRRTDDTIKDDITLKTPAASGTDYNTLTYLRTLEPGKEGRITYESKFNYTSRINKKKTILSGTADLKNVPEGGDARLTGSITVKQQLPGEESSNSLVMEPDLLIGVHEGVPVALGSVKIQEKLGKNVVEEATIEVETGTGTAIQWQDAAEAPAAALTVEQQAAMAAQLVPHLALLPSEDVGYIAADIPAEQWQSIVDAAQNALLKEVTP